MMIWEMVMPQKAKIFCVIIRSKGETTMKKQIIIGTITLAIVAGGLIYGSNKKAKKSNSYVYSASEVLSYNKSVDYTKVKFKKLILKN